MLLLPVYHVKKPTIPLHLQCMKQGRALARFPRRWSLCVLRYQTEKIRRETVQHPANSLFGSPNPRQPTAGFAKWTKSTLYAVH